MSLEINIRDIGPVTEFEYRFNAFGLHVLKGRNGSGKSTTLRTVQLATDGHTDSRLVKRDGTPRGEATIAGKTLRVVKQIREEGELTIDGLGSFSIADLHSPGFEKVTTRDRHRIKTLVQLTGVTADASLFHGILGGKEAFEKIIPVDSLTTDDLVEMAGRVKRALEREALRIEGLEKTALADARAQASIFEAVDTTREHRDEVLQATLEIAIKTHTSRVTHLEALKSKREAAADSITKADEARARLAQLGTGKTVAEATKELDRAKLDMSDAEAVVRRIEAELDTAKANARAAGTKYDAAREAVEQAKREEALHAELHEAINSAGLVAPVPEEIAKAEADALLAADGVTSAKAAVTQGVRIREALAAQAKSERFNAQAKELHDDAKRLRDAATDTADVLTGAISRLNDCPLRIRLDDDGEPRLVVATDRSETEPFDELSDGERWIHVVQIAAASNRLIVLPQHAFGELSPSSKEQLHRLAIANQCYILTAVADDCELHGESYAEAIRTEAAE